MIRDKFPDPKRELNIRTGAREADLIKMYLDVLKVEYKISYLMSDRNIWIKDLNGVDIGTINAFLEALNSVEREICHMKDMEALRNKKKHWWNKERL
jgi:hypothetical protein